MFLDANKETACLCVKFSNAEISDVLFCSSEYQCCFTMLNFP